MSMQIKPKSNQAFDLLFLDDGNTKKFAARFDFVIYKFVDTSRMYENNSKCEYLNALPVSRIRVLHL